MDHMAKKEYCPPLYDVRELSDIEYAVYEDFSGFDGSLWSVSGCAEVVDEPNRADRSARIRGEGSSIRRDFAPLSGKITLWLWVRMYNPTLGVNAVTLRGPGGLELLRVDTEGAYFYACDGPSKKKLCRYRNDDWYSVCACVDTVSGTYSLYIDGERQLCNARLAQKLTPVCSVSSGSYGGNIYVNRLLLYPNPVQSVIDAAKGRPVLDARALGVACDGVTVVTQQLQKLLDECSDRGGGVVYLQGGVYLTGCVEMRKNVALYIETDATLKGVTDIASYGVKLSRNHPNLNNLVQGPQKSLIYGDSAENVSILGGGTIDGSGDFPGPYGSESLRVCAILLVGCAGASIRDLCVIDAGMWTIPLTECDGLYIRDININSCWYPNRDGIDICDCCDALIENCAIKSDDDALCFKSGNESGCDNVLSRGMFLISTQANGIKFGTYSYGGFKNCVCEDCVIKDTRTCAICVESVDGGLIKNLAFRRINIRNVESVFVIIVGDRCKTPPWGEKRVGHIDGVVFENIEAENVLRSYGTYIGGLRREDVVYPVKNILFDRVNVTFRGTVTEVPSIPDEYSGQYPESDCFGILPASRFFIRHAENVVFTGCSFLTALPDARPPFFVTDSKNVLIDGESAACFPGI